MVITKFTKYRAYTGIAWPEIFERWLFNEMPMLYWDCLTRNFWKVIILRNTESIVGLTDPVHEGTMILWNVGCSLPLDEA
jgi:hypothetical protein